MTQFYNGNASDTKKGQVRIQMSVASRSAMVTNQVHNVDNTFNRNSKIILIVTRKYFQS